MERTDIPFRPVTLDSIVPFVIDPESDDFAAMHRHEAA